MKLKIRSVLAGTVCGAFCLLSARANALPVPQSAEEKFEISVPASVHAGAITGRAFVVVSTKDKPEPRLVAGSWGDSGPLYGVDVNALAPGQAAVIDASTFGAPGHSLREIPQAITTCKRS